MEDLETPSCPFSVERKIRQKAVELDGRRKNCLSTVSLSIFQLNSIPKDSQRVFGVWDGVGSFHCQISVQS